MIIASPFSGYGMSPESAVDTYGHLTDHTALLKQGYILLPFLSLFTGERRLNKQYKLNHVKENLQGTVSLVPTVLQSQKGTVI